MAERSNLVDLLHFQLETCQQALVNGIRKRIKFMHRNAIDCEVLTGTARIKGKNTPVVRAKLRRFLSTNCGQTNQ
jgi:hypothetical protein